MNGVCGEPQPSNSLRTFGAVLKAFRERAGLTQEALAQQVQYSQHFVASVEQGRRLPPRDLVERAETALDAFGTLRAGARHVTREPGLASWFRRWATLEAEAVSLCTYECRLVPGLLQTEPYVRAVFGNSIPPLTDEQLEAQVTARLDRQRLLTERPNVPFSFILAESVFRQRIGGTVTTRAMLDHVARCGAARNVTLQIMPADCTHHACLDGPLRLLETAEGQWLAYSEGQENGRLISDPKSVTALHQRYATLRSQALTPEDSMSLLERIRGAL